MNDEPLFSILIPVYNVESYLSECLDSILKRQGFDNIEVILIDDGSVDSSPRICDEYAQQYSQVKAFHKSNGGASAARNAGLREASGKYILFIDADDYIEAHSLESIAALIENDGDADLVMLNSSKIYADGSIKRHNQFVKSHFYRQKHEDVLKNMAHDLPDCVWGKLIRRDIIIQNDIFFIEGIICEDVDFSIQLFMHAKTYNAAEFDYYYYRTGREGSVMNQSSNRTFTDLLLIIAKWDSLSGSIYKEHITILRGWNFINYCWVLLTRFRALTKEEKRKYKCNMDTLKHILGYSNEAGAIFVRISYKLFGLTAASWTAAVYAFVFKGLNRWS